MGDGFCHWSLHGTGKDHAVWEEISRNKLEVNGKGGKLSKYLRSRSGELPGWRWLLGIKAQC